MTEDAEMTTVPNEAQASTEALDGVGWATVRSQFEDYKQLLKEFRLEGFFPDDADLVFHYRGLTQEEADTLEDLHVNVENSRRRQNVDVQSAKIKMKTIRWGVERVTRELPGDPPVVSEIEDWQGKPSQIKELPHDIRDELADAIDSFTRMDPETLVSFEKFREMA